MRRGRIPSTTENVTKIWQLGFALLIIGLGGSNVFALDPLGPPSGDMQKGMFRGGIEYSYGTMDLDLINGKANVYRNGLPFGEGIVDDLTISDYKVNTLYTSVGYGIYKNVEVFLRMDAARAKFDDSLWNEGEEFDSNLDLAVGAGVKATFYETFAWKIGGIAQISRAEIDGKLESSSWAVPQPHLVEITTTELQLALGVTYMFSRRVSLYGGPFAHFIQGDFDYAFNRITNDFDTGEYSWEIDGGPTYGGYFGAQIRIARNTSANIEYQQTSNANAFAANIMMRY